MLLDGRESEKVARDLVFVAIPLHSKVLICHLREAIKSDSTCSFAAHVCTLHVEGEVAWLFVQVFLASRETFENWISKAILHDQFDRPNTCVAIKHHRIALTGSGYSLDVINDRRFIFEENFIDIYESSNLDGAQVVQHRWHFTLNSASTLSQTLKHFSLFNMWRMPIEFPTFIRWCDITTKRERWTWRAQVNVKQAIKVDQSRAE